MNLLPKSREEFAQADYWNAFFKKRGDKAFEWYGEYLELCDLIHKYVKTMDKILMLGCGNSQLSTDMYDRGFLDITNIDISPVAIKRMQELNNESRPKMRFMQMDATQMSFADESFSVALDKGTLDALYADDTAEVRATVERYFHEVARTMRPGGRYVCISLLQAHILRELLNFFPAHSFMFRVVHCFAAGRSTSANTSDNEGGGDAMPVFMVIATKFNSLPTAILEFSLNNEKMQRLHTTTDLTNAVRSLQQAALVCSGLARGNIAGHNEVHLDLCRPNEAEKPRYTVHILDRPPARGLGKYAAFIVPQGREVEWLFATTQGRRKLQTSAQYQRLAVVTLHRDQDYDSLEAVKCELADCVRSLAPAGLRDQIPYLSLGEEVGRRETLVSGSSKMSGDFRVEEVAGGDGKIFRRLIFLNNQFVVQSEALVKSFKPKGKKERKKIDIGHLACQHHLYMSVGVQMVVGSEPSSAIQGDLAAMKHILIIGLGGGGLCSFLHAALPHIRITAVEIDPIMLEVAEQYFELKQTKRFMVVIDDGLLFLDTCRKEHIQFDAILFDVDSKDATLGMSCPPPNFLAAPVLANVVQALRPQGLFILNLVCRDEALREKALADLTALFTSVCCYKLDEDINEIVYCSNETERVTIDEWRKLMSNAGNSLNKVSREKKLVNDEMLDVTEFLKDLKL